MTDALIVTRNLTHTYRSGSMTVTAVRDVSLEIERGSTVAIIGITGSGKTTLVQHFNGLLRPTSGAVIVDGLDVGSKDVSLSELRRRVGMLFQSPERQLFERTVYADVAFGPRRLGITEAEVRARVSAALEAVGLSAREHGQRSPFELSGGQMRRAAIAGVLAMEPQVLVLDEPTVGLDAEGRSELYGYLRRLRRDRGITVVVVSHDMAEVAALADRAYVMHYGRLVMQGAPREVFAQPEALLRWGLRPPPISELLAILRARGLDLPHDALSLDSAFDAILRARGNGHEPGGGQGVQ